MARGVQEGGLREAGGWWGGGVRNQATLHLTLGVSAFVALQIVSLISSPPKRWIHAAVPGVTGKKAARCESQQTKKSSFFHPGNLGCW